MKIAFAHDYLTRFGGAERMLKTLHQAYPDAPIFTLIARDHVVREHFPDADIRTSFAQRAPFSHRAALPLLPFAVESFDTSGYDVIISGTSAYMKGLVTRSSTRHISYVHTPPRYLWEDRQEYTQHHVPTGLRWAAHPLLHMIRLWDQQAARRPDALLANSEYTKQRIKSYYDLDAEVVTPPVDVARHSLSKAVRQRYQLPQEYFLLVSRLTWWKRPDIAIDAMSALGHPLIVVGEGPDAASLKRGAGENVRFLGTLSDDEVRQLMWGARALLHPSLEDFGMTAVEAMAQGTPVVAFRQGGATETVQEGLSGVFFDDPHPLALANAARLALERTWDADAIRDSVSHHAEDHFLKKIKQAVSE